jgi:hypothetical protein
MKAALSDGSDSSETLAEANEHAAAKVDYYRAARQAMPDLLQIATREETGNPSGEELTRIFHDFGEDKDHDASGMLEAKLNLCPKSDQRDQTRLAVERAQQIAEQFVIRRLGYPGAAGKSLLKISATARWRFAVCD